MSFFFLLTFHLFIDISGVSSIGRVRCRPPPQKKKIMAYGIIIHDTSIERTESDFHTKAYIVNHLLEDASLSEDSPRLQAAKLK